MEWWDIYIRPQYDMNVMACIVLRLIVRTRRVAVAEQGLNTKQQL